jgi:hypothetical protein
MSPTLPIPIARYVEAENRGEAGSLAECFAPDAVVHDEGRTIRGRPAIEAWNAQARAKYRHAIQPLRMVQTGRGYEVVNRLTGDFPGSPVELTFVFQLDGDRIAALEIG